MFKDLEKKILESKVVSFDMFDTLVIRLIDNPEILFDMIGLKYNIKDFRKIRINMQAEYGLVLQKEYGYPHANIDEIYDYIKKNSGIKNAKEIMNYEISKEIEMLYQNNEIYKVYEFAKKHKKRVVVTSDMYLLKDTISKILNKCGYDKIDKIYLSSDQRKAKFDGTLYDALIEQEGVLPSEIIHIGDSIKDDINMASSKGINVYHYSNTTIDKSSSISSSLYGGIYRLICQNNDDSWIKIGAKAGLLYLGLYDSLLNSPYDNISFLARDGYNLYNLFKKYSNKKVQYCYTSRRALLLASITKIDGLAKHNLPPFTYSQTIKEVLEYVGLNDIFDINDLKKIGFNSFDDRFTTIEEINRFKDIYSLKEKEVLRKCEEERKYAIKYFEKLGILNKDNLFFDCGWNGSSQFLLETFVHNCYPQTNFNFYYTGILENPKSITQLKNKKHSAYLFDIGKNQDIANRVHDSIVMLELFFGAPENSILRYDKKGVVFDNFESELEYRKKIYEGIDKFFGYALPIYNEFDFSIDPRESIMPIIDLIENPSTEEATLIGDIENVDAFAKQKGVHKYIAKLSLEDIKSNPNIEVYWKYGLLKRNDINYNVKKIIAKRYKIKLHTNDKLKCRICGLNNPSVNLFGYCSFAPVVEIKADGKLLNNSISYNSLDGTLLVSSNIKKTNKKINVKVMDNCNQLIKEYTIKNSLAVRILSKRYDYFYSVKRIANKGINFFKRIARLFIHKIKTLFGLVKKVWVKYHFIIPPRVIINFIVRKITHNYAFDCGHSTSSLFLNPFNLKDYNLWLKNYLDTSKIEKLKYNPLISFVIPVYNVKEELLKACLDSILNQSYKNIEICIADDCSTNAETLETLKKYENKYNNIKVVYREKNGHISAASNSALELVTGEYVAMMDNDDVIPNNAIYEMVKAINQDKTIDMIYTDEDKLDVNGNRCDPHFKSDYAPDTLMSVNYFCHFTLLKTSILRNIGGWKVGLEGAQDWDLFLRFVEKAKNIYHLPKVLYHWRMIPGSTSMSLGNKKYAMDTAKKSIEDALERRKTPGIVHLHDKVPYYWVEYKYDKEPLVSIIIPTKDYASTLDNCLKSIYEKSTYKNYEILVVDNRSKEKETFDLFENYKKNYSNFRVIKADMEFNYSKINNIAAKKAKGEYLLLLNNDTEIITNNWIELMVGYAMQKHIGAVGAKLIYPDRTIQHGGVILGMGGVAGHAFVNAPMDYEGIYGRLCVPYNYSVVTAACLMVKKSKYLEVGGLTEQLKVAYNDVDFCLKLVDKKYYNIVLPMVELFHYESKSRGLEDTAEKKKRFENESRYMYDHWHKYILDDPMYNCNLSRIAVFMLDVNNKKGR